MGPIIGGINAAAVTAMGIAQIQQIKQQKYNSSGNISSPSAGGAGSVQTVDFQNVSVNPLLDPEKDAAALREAERERDRDEQPKEQRVVILQSDLEDSSKQVEIRQTSSTF